MFQDYGVTGIIVVEALCEFKIDRSRHNINYSFKLKGCNSTVVWFVGLHAMSGF